MTGINVAASSRELEIDRDDTTTSELRHDWLADRWVIIAPQRSERPNDFVRSEPKVLDPASCPFCIGHELQTPDAVRTYHSKKMGREHDWRVRVIPNKFPAVRTSRTPNSTDTADVGVGGQLCDCNSKGRIDLFQRRDLSGGHEVIVESPEHVQSITELDRETMGLVFCAYRDRLKYWLHERKLAYAVVFKNVGIDAGASLAHAHSQLIAADVVPTDILRSVERMKLFFQKESTCLFCRMAEDELEQQVRVVEETPDFLAFCPFASRLPSLVTIIPKLHRSQFECLSDFEADQVSWLVHRLVRRIEKRFPDAAYNFVLHTAPHTSQDSQAFHWRLELFPRLTKVAGFEWGSDCYINPLSPEDAARSLRQVGV